MRAVDEYTMLIENPNSNNILKLIKAFGKEKIQISDVEQKELFKVLNEKFVNYHKNIKKFDDDLWDALDYIDISVDWINVICAYKEKQQDTKKIQPVPSISNIRNLNTSEQKYSNELTPKIFLEVEESFKNNNFTDELKKDREKLVRIIWELYQFSNTKKTHGIEFKNSIDWDLLYELITFTYEKIILTNMKDYENQLQNNEKSSILNKEYKKLKDICTSLSTLVFLSPVASSRGYYKYSVIIQKFAVSQLGECPFSALFVGFELGDLKYINTNENNKYESQWFITNINGLLAGFLGQFLDEKKYFRILKSYNENASETFINEFPNGAEEDYSKLINTMVHLANSNWVSKEAILRFINTISIEHVNKRRIAELIYLDKNKLINLDSASLLLSNPFINYHINYFDLEEIEKIFIQLLELTNEAPKIEGLWRCNNVFDFESITYQSAYFKSSRTLLVACSTFWLIDEDPLSLIIEGCEKLSQEGFSNCAIVLLLYYLLSFVNDSDFKKTKISHIAHKKLFNLLSKIDIKKEITEPYFQILDYCSSRVDCFGFLFCEIINNIKIDFNFNNIIKVDFKKIDTEKNEYKFELKNMTSLKWLQHNSSESFIKISQEIFNLRQQPPLGIWERKYKNIIGDIKILFGEIDTVAVNVFRIFYKEFYNEMRYANDIKFEFFQSKIINDSKDISLGSIPKLFYEFNDFNRKNPKELENILTKIQNKKITKIIKKISESEQLQISLNAITKYRHQFSHSNAPLKLTSIKTLLIFIESDMNDFLEIFNMD